MNFYTVEKSYESWENTYNFLKRYIKCTKHSLLCFLNKDSFDLYDENEDHKMLLIKNTKNHEIVASLMLMPEVEGRKNRLNAIQYLNFSNPSSDLSIYLLNLIIQEAKLSGYKEIATNIPMRDDSEQENNIRVIFRGAGFKIANSIIELPNFMYYITDPNNQVIGFDTWVANYSYCNYYTRYKNQ